MHSFSGDNLTSTKQTLACEIDGKFFSEKKNYFLLSKRNLFHGRESLHPSQVAHPAYPGFLSVSIPPSLRDTSPWQVNSPSPGISLGFLDNSLVPIYTPG